VPEPKRLSPERPPGTGVAEVVEESAAPLVEEPAFMSASVLPEADAPHLDVPWNGERGDPAGQTERRGAILRAVGSAAERLLGNAPWEQNVDPVLAELGEATRVSRAYVFRNLRGDAGELLMDMCFEWVAPGIAPVIVDSGNHSYPYMPEYEHYVGKLSLNQAMTVYLGSASPTDRADLVDEGIFSTTFLPIFDGDEWWGYLGFDDCLVERAWSDAELDALRAAAATLGAAIRMERVSRASRVAEERYRRLVEQIPTVTYIEEVAPGDPTELATVYVSPQIERLLGYTPEQWMRDPDLWDHIVHPDDLDAANTVASRAYEDGTPLSVEYRMIAHDGRTLWVREEASLFRDEDGAPKFWQGVYIDITELKRSEEDLNIALIREREATERLRALDELKNTFLQAVSHDLRTPLAAILGLAVTLAREDVVFDDADVRDMATRIAKNSRKLDRMVADLLDLDRLSRGIIEPNLQNADIGAIVRDLAKELDVDESHIMILDALGVTLPVDRPKVERIVENLLANALRHTPQGSRIWVRTRPQDGGVLLTVEDDGPGVPADLRGAVFEPFRQGPSPSSHSPGAGVGLALVARFTELHRGRAWVDERSGGGASFHVFLPGVTDRPVSERSGATWSGGEP